MCGRFAITLPPEAMRSLFDYEERPNFPPRYNIAPTQPIPIIRAERDGDRLRRRFMLARWGLIPGFVKEPKSFPVLFNARSETLGDKSSFRAALPRRRSLVPPDPFYEWQRVGKAARPYVARPYLAQPYLARRVDGAAMALAGLWETWHGADGSEVDTACIITTGANGDSAAIHPRLPALIDPGDFAAWLDPDENRYRQALALLRPVENNTLAFVPISDLVNKVANDGPDVQAPATARSEAWDRRQPSFL